MAPAINTYCQPVSPGQRILNSGKKLHITILTLADLPNYYICCNRTNSILWPIWSNISINPNYYNLMMRSNRTTKHGTLLLILYTSRITSLPYSTDLHPNLYRLPKFSTDPLLNSTPSHLLKKCFPMVRIHNSIHSKDTPIWPPPVITKSTYRSFHRWNHSSCSHTT